MKKFLFIVFLFAYIHFMFLRCLGKSEKSSNEDLLLLYLISKWNETDDVDPSVTFQTYPMKLSANIPKAISISTKADIQFIYLAKVDTSSTSYRNSKSLQVQNSDLVITINIINPDNGEVVGGIVSRKGSDTFEIKHTPKKDKIYILSVSSNSDVTLIPTLKGVNKKPKPSISLAELYTTITKNSAQENILIHCYLKNQLNDNNPTSFLAYCIVAQVASNYKPTFLSNAKVKFSVGSGFTATVPYSPNSTKNLSACVPTADRSSLYTSFVYVDCVSSGSITNGAKVILQVQESSKKIDKSFELYIPQPITGVKLKTEDGYSHVLNTSNLTSNRSFLLSKNKGYEFSWNLPEVAPSTIGFQSIRSQNSSDSINSKVFSSEDLRVSTETNLLSNLDVGINQTGPGTNTIMLSPKLIQNNIVSTDLYNGLVTINGVTQGYYSGLSLSLLDSSDMSKGGEVYNFSLTSYDYGLAQKQNIAVITE
ncbi:MAG: hypothetical protein H7A23_21635 [Leptospiraceae bacterium]|nr:hypothetical protein [Leptospiraceae bacterium]MCP5497166.1 hypothetical protein [Leptospiraceae bacterium]